MVIQKIYRWHNHSIFILQIFYLPLTLFVPPSHFISHKQFNLIYQLCLHTTLIGDLKPFDWFLNTAKHHRVHHGMSKTQFVFRDTLCERIFYICRLQSLLFGQELWWRVYHMGSIIRYISRGEGGNRLWLSG